MKKAQASTISSNQNQKVQTSEFEVLNTTEESLNQQLMQDYQAGPVDRFGRFVAQQEHPRRKEEILHCNNRKFIETREIKLRKVIHQEGMIGKNSYEYS